MRKATAILMLVVSSIMAGCTDSTSKETSTKKSVAGPTGSVEKVVSSFNNLSDEAVLIAVDDSKLTKGDFLNWVDLRINMAKFSQGQQIDDELKLFIRDQMLSTVTNDYASQIVAGEYAKTVGIVASTGHVARCRTGFSYACHMPNTKWEKIVGRFPKPLQRTIEERVQSEAILAAVFEKFVSENAEKVSVGDEEVEKLYKDYLDYNKVCSATNFYTWAKASNIWNRVMIGGEDFKELAVQFDEDEYREEDGVWGTFQVSDFTDEPEIWKLTSRFRPGWISPPIEADNGLMILKVDSITDGSADVNSAGYIPSPSAEFTISRIFLHLPLFMEKVDKETFALQTRQAKKNIEFKKFLGDLILKADVKFPCGTEIFSPSDANSQDANAMNAAM